MLIKAVLRKNSKIEPINMNTLLTDPILLEKQRLISKLHEIFNDTSLELDIKRIIIDNYIIKLLNIVSHAKNQPINQPLANFHFEKKTEPNNVAVAEKPTPIKKRNYIQTKLQNPIKKRKKSLKNFLNQDKEHDMTLFGDIWGTKTKKLTPRKAKVASIQKTQDIYKEGAIRLRNMED